MKQEIDFLVRVGLRLFEALCSRVYAERVWESRSLRIGQPKLMTTTTCRNASPLREEASLFFADPALDCRISGSSLNPGNRFAEAVVPTTICRAGCLLSKRTWQVP
ncbi:Protein of unknown function [Pyronema omphalodes CBS 100304]|uniref:Uncharacterized protein n=1 Tax=Pyronema omphalodes (strain CBS 100304) TaxID=1076935 RepID=U4LLB3_PYROM|nr:Protein of unknown function [Pyronema omphalodes CBS 100304]